jgi:MmyB-like transcription regulator ligand binding domain
MRPPAGAGNVLRLMFHPDGLRPFVENWDTVAQALLRRVHREAVGGALDDKGHQLLSEILDYPDVPPRWRTPDLGTPLVPVVPVSFRHGAQILHFFSAITRLGTPQDITLQELRVECFFPMDDATAAAAHRLQSALTRNGGNGPFTRPFC